MEIHQPLPLLGGLSAAQFMRRHWQKKPLLVRQAVPAMVPPIDRQALFALAGREERRVAADPPRQGRLAPAPGALARGARCRR